MIFYLLGTLGLIGLFYGGDILVKGTVDTAKNLGIPAHLVAVTLVALGTSIPELFVSVNAVIKGSPDIAWGNVVGSNIANLMLVIGGACLFATLIDTSKSLRIDIIWMSLATILVVFFGLYTSGVTPIIGVFFILILIGILTFMTTKSKVKKKFSIKKQMLKNNSFLSQVNKAVITTILGIVLVLISCELLIYGAINISKIYGIEESLIGVTIVALGTSMPEISASIAATRKGHTDIAIGNVLGSNLFNCLGILGASAVVSYPSKLITPISFLNFDLLIMLVITLSIGGTLYYYKKVPRFAGPILILLYILYISLSFL